MRRQHRTTFALQPTLDIVLYEESLRDYLLRKAEEDPMAGPLINGRVTVEIQDVPPYQGKVFVITGEIEEEE